MRQSAEKLKNLREKLLRDLGKNFYELNIEMLHANQRITATHAYSSKWYTWPLMLRPIYYWNKDLTLGTDTFYERIYLLGNPFVWWVSTIGVAYFLASRVCMLMGFMVSRLRKKSKKKKEGESQPVSVFNQVFLGAGYLVNLLAFIFIGRVMFLYHYFTALIFAIMIAAVTIAKNPKPRVVLICMLIAGTVLGFFIIYPVTYGTILRNGWPSSIFWLKSWI